MTDLFIRGRPLMIWGGGGNRGKKISEALLQEKINLQGLPPGKKAFRRKKKIGEAIARKK